MTTHDLVQCTYQQFRFEMPAQAQRGWHVVQGGTALQLFQVREDRSTFGHGTFEHRTFPTAPEHSVVVEFELT